MNKLNFHIYSKTAEISGGDYWVFLDATKESLETDDIFLFNISKVMKMITNYELNSKIKKKLFSLAMEFGISFRGIDCCLDIFEEEELKTLFEEEFRVRILKKISIDEHYENIMSFIKLLKSVNNLEWEYNMLVNILNIVKKDSDKGLLIEIIEYNKDCKEIYERLIIEYYSYFPDFYKKYLEMKQDPEYVLKRSLQFMNADINIGIDSKIKIAPEIEANIDYALKIELDNQKGFKEYQVRRDATVINGNEITPIHPFHNIPEDIAKFCGLCESMKDIGYYYDEISGNAAGQINLGLDYLDTKDAILNFYEIYGNCEELLYYIANEAGQLFRQDVYSNSRIKAISEIIGRRALDEELSRQDVINLFNSSLDFDDQAIAGLHYKKNSVCLRGTSDEDYRLEFRIPNGGCNYRTWIDNIRLFGKIIEIAKKLADMMKKDYLSDEERYLLELKINLQDSSLSLEEKLTILMNLLFEDEKIKQIYYNRYKKTQEKIKATGTMKYMTYGAVEPSFAEVEFLSKYQSMFDYDYEGPGLIVTYDPESDTITSSRKK